MWGRVNVENLRRWSFRGAVDPRIALMDDLGIFHDIFLFLSVDRKWRRRRRSLSLGFDVFKVLKTHHLPVLLCTWQEHRHILAKLGAHAEVDEWVVEAGRLGEETSDNAGCAWHMEAPGGPHGNHCIWRPGHDESCADHNGNLKRNMREKLSGWEWWFPGFRFPAKYSN